METFVIQSNSSFKITSKHWTALEIRHMAKSVPQPKSLRFIYQLFSSSSSSGSRPGSFVNKCSPNFSSMSVSLLSEDHRRTLIKTRLTGRAFHQGRWCLLPREWVTFHAAGLPLLVENLMGAFLALPSSAGFAAV